MSKHDKKCEVILCKNNLWNACWCHERALEAEVERLTARLAEAETRANELAARTHWYFGLEAEVERLTNEIKQWKKVYDVRGAALQRPCINCGHVPLVIHAAALAEPTKEQP